MYFRCTQRQSTIEHQNSPCSTQGAHARAHAPTTRTRTRVTATAVRASESRGLEGARPLLPGSNSVIGERTFRRRPSPTLASYSTRHVHGKVRTRLAMWRPAPQTKGGAEAIKGSTRRVHGRLCAGAARLGADTRAKSKRAVHPCPWPSAACGASMAASAAHLMHAHTVCWLPAPRRRHMAMRPGDATWRCGLAMRPGDGGARRLVGLSGLRPKS